MSENTNIEARNKVEELLKAGTNLSKIEGYLLFEHDFGVTQAKDLVKEVREELGMEFARGATNLPDVVRFARENHGKLDKGDLIQGMMAAGNYTHSTAQHMYNYIAMAIEWARQEAASENAHKES